MRPPAEATAASSGGSSERHGGRCSSSERHGGRSLQRLNQWGSPRSYTPPAVEARPLPSVARRRPAYVLGSVFSLSFGGATIMCRQCLARVIATYRTHNDSATVRRRSSSNKETSGGGRNLRT